MIRLFLCECEAWLKVDYRSIDTCLIKFEVNFIYCINYRQMCVIYKYVYRKRLIEKRIRK